MRCLGELCRITPLVRICAERNDVELLAVVDLEGQDMAILSHLRLINIMFSQVNGPSTYVHACVSRSLLTNSLNGLVHGNETTIGILVRVPRPGTWVILSKKDSTDARSDTITTNQSIGICRCAIGKAHANLTIGLFHCVINVLVKLHLV